MDCCSLEIDRLNKEYCSRLENPKNSVLKHRDGHLGWHIATPWGEIHKVSNAKSGAKLLNEITCVLNSDSSTQSRWRQ